MQIYRSLVIKASVSKNKSVKRKTMKWIFLLLTISFSSTYAQHNLPLANDFQQLLTQLGNYRAMGEFTAKRSGASQNFNVHHYNCNWTVDPSVQYIRGDVSISFQTITETSEIRLDLLDSMEVDSVLSGNLKLSFLHSGNVLKIEFGTSLPALKQSAVTVFYHGRPPVNGFGSFVTSAHNGNPIMWTLSEPYGSRDWWPCKDGLQDKADSIDVYITAPDIYTSVSNGLRVQQTVSNGMKTTHWKHRYPIATYLVCMAVTNYTEFVNEWDVPGGPLMMQTFCYPENLWVFQQEIQKAYDAMKIYADLVGPYPFIREKYGHVQFGFGGGEEHQTSTFISWPSEILVAHEMAHQWFGDKVTCRSWEDIWLNEGFATFMSGLYREQKYPATIVPGRKVEIEYITSEPNGSVFVDDTTKVSRIFDSRLSYYKGEHLLYMLRLILGDPAFFKGVRAYLDDPDLAYGFAVTSDLQRHLEEASGHKLDYFFNEWFYGQGYPSYKIEWWQQRNGLIGVRVNQTTSDPSVKYFHLPLPLRLMAGTEMNDVIIHPEFNGQIFYLKSAIMPDSLHVDPDYWLITKGNEVKKIDKPSSQTVLTLFPNPATDFLNIHANGFEETKMTVQVFDVNGRLVGKNEYSVNGSMNTTLNIQSLASGIYLLRIGTNGGFNKVFKIKKGL